MAVRARLSAPPPPKREWPWHKAEWRSLASHLLWTGDRRMEAENYLSGGYGLRLAVEERAVGWKRLRQLARVWQPSRLKGIQVSPEYGTPFLAATQVFDIRPVPRKWLALARTHEATERFVKAGTILVTCSGSVGRATLAHEPHEKTLISHDLLRVEPESEPLRGWVYAFLRSPQARAMMEGARYGHIIKHLEVSHLEALPIPILAEHRAKRFQHQTNEILDLRNRAHRLSLEAEEQFANILGEPKIKDRGESGFSIRARRLFFGRRRLEAIPHNPSIAAIREHLARNGNGFSSVEKAGFDIWLPARFKRIPAPDGIGLIESSDVFEINPDVDKFVADVDFGDSYNGRVKAGWLVMARSGQTYGLNGSAAFATAAHEDKVVSDDLLRIAPAQNCSLPIGYLYIALSHPVLGRPLVKAIAYGSSIPHIEAADLKAFEVVRLPSEHEARIAELAEKAAVLRAQADILERKLAVEAGEILDRFISGDTSDVVTH